MFKLFLKLLDRCGRRRTVMDRVNNEPYLERYYLFLTDRTQFPFNVFLHKFLKSDPDDLHDHPWPYATVILKGGYWEWTPVFDHNGQKLTEVAKWRAPGHIRFNSATSLHRIELDPGVECWTLFMPGPKQREWGFVKSGVWQQWQEYLNTRSGAK
jgi:hypothetical protein